MLMRLKKTNATRNNKSLSGSIKKHIFHNNLVSKTPKRGPQTVTSTAISVSIINQSIHFE